MPQKIFPANHIVEKNMDNILNCQLLQDQTQPISCGINYTKGRIKRMLLKI